MHEILETIHEIQATVHENQLRSARLMRFSCVMCLLMAAHGFLFLLAKPGPLFLNKLL